MTVDGQHTSEDKADQKNRLSVRTEQTDVEKEAVICNLCVQVLRTARICTILIINHPPTAPFKFFIL